MITRDEIRKGVSQDVLKLNKTNALGGRPGQKNFAGNLFLQDQIVEQDHNPEADNEKIVNYDYDQQIVENNPDRDSQKSTHSYYNKEQHSANKN